MEINFNGKVVVITGSAGGIGKVMVQKFAESGAFVAACDLKDTQEKISDNNSKNIRCYDFDITNSYAVEDAMKKINADFGKIDVLVNNAGINVGPGGRKTIDEFDDGMWQAILNVDLNGVYNCSKKAVAYMKDGGAIINVSSVVGMVPLRNQCSFAAAKAAVINLSKAMAIELADKNIRTNVVAPGTVAIEITNKLWQDDSAMKSLLAHIPQKRQGKPGDIANAAMFLASDLAQYINGAVLPVDGGWTAGGYARNF